jgi:hypothetical protein
MGKFFGYYAKCEGAGGTVAIIFGRAREKSFIQIVTGEASFCVDFPKSDCKIGRRKFGIKIGDNILNEHGMRLCIKTETLEIAGDIKFGAFSKIRGDAMGFLRFVPFLECRHMIKSMRHSLSGEIVLNGKRFDMDNGRGYIEGDRGKSFPEKYFWAQSHAAPDIDICVSCATVRAVGLKFNGTICIVHIGGEEHRLATYRGACVKTFSQNALEIKQGAYTLFVNVPESVAVSHPLFAPRVGKMTRVIHESLNRTLRFYFTRRGKTVFDIIAPAAFEYS